VSFHSFEQDELHRRVKDADARLARYERLSQIALLLTLLLGAGLLALVITQIWGIP